MTENREAIIRVGITGAAGNIGTTLTESLSDQYSLSLFDHQYDVSKDYRQKFKTVKVDLSQAEEVEGIFGGLDAIIHLAADKGSAAPWESVLTNNIVTTYNVFEEARRAGVVRIVFASTNHVQHGQSMAKMETASLSPFYVRHRGYMRLSDPPSSRFILRGLEAFR